MHNHGLVWAVVIVLEQNRECSSLSGRDFQFKRRLVIHCGVFDDETSRADAEGMFLYGYNIVTRFEI